MAGLRLVLGLSALALAWPGCSDPGPDPLEFIDDADERARHKAAIDLGRRETAEAAQALRGRIQDPSTRVRVAVARGLATAAGKRAVPDLVRMTGDRAPEVRIAAVEGLSKLGGAQSIEALLDVLHDEDGRIRRDVRQGLLDLGLSGESQIQRAASRRRHAFVLQAGSKSWSRRLEASRELALCGDSQALEVLGRLAADGEREVATAAGRGLGRAGADLGWDRLARLLDPSEPLPLRRAVLQGLAQAGPMAQAGEGARVLCPLLSDRQLGRHAVAAALDLEVNCDLNDLRELVETGDSAVTRLEAAAVLVSASAMDGAQEEAVTVAADLLWNAGGNRDLPVLAALEVQPGSSAEGRVLKAVDGYRERSRRWVPLPSPPEPDADAEEAMAVDDPRGGLRGDEAVARLLSHFPPRQLGWVELFPAKAGGPFRGSPDPDEVATVLIVAAESGLDVAAVSGVADLARGATDPQVRAAAVWAMADPAHLEDDDPRIRAVAAEAVGRGGPDLEGGTKARLALLLAERDPRTRAAAAATLAATGDAAALRPLLAAFERWHEPAVARALGTLGQREAAGPLARFLGEGVERSVPELTVAILEALALVGGSEQADAVAPFIGHPDPEARCAAIAAARSIGGERLERLVLERRSDFARAVRDAASLEE